MEPTRQEWKDWAAVMAAKERPKPSSNYEFLLGLMAMTPEAYQARMSQAAIMYGRIQQQNFGRCPCCGRGYSALGGLMGGLFG